MLLPERVLVFSINFKVIMNDIILAAPNSCTFSTPKLTLIIAYQPIKSNFWFV